MKILRAKWLVEMGEYISENPRIVVNSITHASISAALDNCCESDPEPDEEGEEDVDVLSDEDCDHFKQ